MDVLPSENNVNQASPADKYGDEYPIIWFEPHIDSEEKRAMKTLIEENKSIHFFSRFDETFKFVQGLAISFLLIVPSHFEEQKLLKDFENLKDTIGKRLFDFEEEELLKNLLKDNEDIRSLNVYAFVKREDFLNEMPSHGDEEEFMLMCDIDEIAKHFVEEFTIILCGPNISSKDNQILISELEIQEGNIVTDFNELLKRINNYTGLPYHLILSGENQVERIIDQMEALKDLLCLYIYDEDLARLEGIKKNKERTIQIIKTSKELLPKIKEGIRTMSKAKNTFPVFTSIFDDRDKSHINHLHYSLKGFINFKNWNQAKRDFMKLAKRIYQSKKLIEFEKGYLAYNKKEILQWYTEESPVNKFINNCLRIASDDSILYCRFALKDLERAIQEEHTQDNERFNGVVYRAAYISSDELEKLSKNIGSEIEMCGFLSTSTNKKVAINFLNKDITHQVFVTIIVPPFFSPEQDEQGFANLKKLSKYNEEEILFNVRSRFQVLEVGKINIEETNECRHLVLLYGPHLLRKSLTMQKPQISFKFQIPVGLKCNFCSSAEKSLFAFQGEGTQISCKECLIKGYVPKNTFLFSIDQKDEDTKKIDLIGKVLEFSNEASLTEYYKSQQCHECLGRGKEKNYKWINPKAESENIIIQCAECFNNTKENKLGHLLISEESSCLFWGNRQNKWEEADAKFKTQKFEESSDWGEAMVFLQTQNSTKSNKFSVEVLKNIVKKRKREKIKLRHYGMIGFGSRELGNNQKALEYNSKILHIFKFAFGEKHLETAIAYGNLASVYKNLGKYQEASEYHWTALKIMQSLFGDDHPITAGSYCNLGLVYLDLGKGREALENHKKAFNIFKFIYGERHPQVAISSNNLAQVYKWQGKYKDALKYSTNSWEINKYTYGEIHPETALSLNNLAEIYSDLGIYQKALKYQLKSVEIIRIINEKLNQIHHYTGICIANLASLYLELGRPQDAIDYHQEALKIRQSIHKKNHPELASSYCGLGLANHCLRNYQEALKNHEKALEIDEDFYGKMHLKTATSYHNLAEVDQSLGNHEKAIKLYEKALEIRKSYNMDLHADSATSCFQLGLVYHSLGKHEEAHEKFQKALKIRKFIYGESSPIVADLYSRLGTVYSDLGNYQSALESHKKALQIRESLDEIIHPYAVTSYLGLAKVYLVLEKYQEALQENLKGLEILKAINEKSNHMLLSTAWCYDNLVKVFIMLKNPQEAINYQTKALEILISIYGENHFSVENSYTQLGVLYRHLGKHEEELKNHIKAFKITESLNGEKHSKTIFSCYNLGSMHYNLGKCEEAFTYHQKAYHIQKTSYGEANPSTQAMYANLVSVYPSFELESKLSAAEPEK